MDKKTTGLFAYISGHLAEKKACTFLKKKGFKKIAQNVKGLRGYGVCELDLVMRDKNTLVFVEVKKRKDINDAFKAIPISMQKRLYRGAEYFLAQHPEYKDLDCRFDAVFISDNGQIEHVSNIIEETS